MVSKTASVIGDFVVRHSDKLFYGPGEYSGMAGKPFRFISFNSCDAIMNPKSPTGLPDEYELNDIVESVRMMGGTVIRVFCLTAGCDGNNRHIVAGPGIYNEEAFRVLDRLLQICNTKGVRLIIPLSDNWDFVKYAPIDFYSSWRSKSRQEFYTDPDVINDFRSTISDVLNRVNHYTNVRYKDDKAVLAWETGNELIESASHPTWIHEIARHIKEQDPNHLVVDGNFGISSHSLDDPYVDIVSNHYYPWVVDTDYAKVCRADRLLAKGRKAFIVGEFGYLDDPGPDTPPSSHQYKGMMGTESLRALLDEVINNGTAGAMAWAYRCHRRDGGFYNHNIGYETFRWPGFPEGEMWHEAERMALTKSKAYAIRNLPEPPAVVPRPPVLLFLTEDGGLVWRGCAGASSYDIYRSTSENGPWEIRGKDISDGKTSLVNKSNPFFIDTGAIAGQKYYYAVIARNAAGESRMSNVKFITYPFI